MAADVLRSVVIDGKRLECRLIGAPQAGTPVLVFLHEGLGSMGLWRDFPDRAAALCGMPALVWTRAGYGGSDPVELPRPLDYMQHEGRVVLPALLDELGLDDVILFGHSDGGSIALIHAAADAGGRVRGVIAAASHSFVEDMCVEAIAQVKTLYDDGPLRERLARHHGANVDCAFRGWNDSWLNPDFKRWNIREDLTRIRVPVLLIQGEDDEYATLAQVTEPAGLIKGRVETLVLPDCGHSPHKDQPQAVLDAAAAFVRTLL